MYRRFVPNVPRTAAPISDLLKKDCTKELPLPTVKQIEAFEKLRQALISAPILQLSGPKKPYSVDTDACDHQVVAALFQEDEEGFRHPVGVWRRTLLPAERNYSASEREYLAVVCVAQILRPYLEGKHFVVHTDHAALRLIFDLEDASNRLARWRLRLLEFNFEVRHRKGCENTVADAVSRFPTFGHTHIAPDLDIPCLVVECDHARRRVVHHVDKKS